MKKPLSNTFNRTRKARNDILMKPTPVEEQRYESFKEFYQSKQEVTIGYIMFSMFTQFICALLISHLIIENV